MTGDKRQSKRNAFTAWLNRPQGTAALFVVAIILLNLVASHAYLRWDITGPRSYSLSRASRELVRTLDKPLHVQVFFAKNLQAPYSSVYQYVQDILGEYKNAANKNFSCTFYDMGRPENQNLARNYGLNQIQIREVKNNEVGFKNVYMGMVLTYADQMEVIDGIVSSDGLEYKITTAMSGIIAATNDLSNLSGPVTATLYRSQILSELHIQGYDRLSESVHDAVDALNKKYRGRIELSEVSPPSEDVAYLRERYGVPSVPLKDNSTGVTSYGTLALVLESGDAYRCIPFGIGQSIDLFRGAVIYTLQGLDGLEDDIDASIQSLASNVTVIAWSTGHGELSTTDSEQGAGFLAEILNERYTLRNVSLADDEIPVGVRTLIIDGPKDAFSDEELYKIDQFILRGGNVMIFADPFDMVQTQYYPQYVPLSTGLEKILDRHGITLNHEYVMDEECAYSYDNRTGQQSKTYYIPLVQKYTLNQKNPVSKNLGYVGFIIPGSVDSSAAQKRSGQKVTVLASSSDKSWAMRDNIMLSPQFINPPSERSGEHSYDMAVLVEGEFESAFGSRPASENQDGIVEFGESHLSKSVSPGKILVIATSYITGPDVAQGFFQNTVMFLENAVDYMNGREDLCTMRTKGLSVSALRTTTGAFVSMAKYFNEIGLAVLVALAGLSVMLRRKKRRAAIRMSYNPDDERERRG